jgi:hypothetical protein
MLPLQMLLWAVVLAFDGPVDDPDTPSEWLINDRRAHIVPPVKLDVTGSWKPFNDPGYGVGVWVSFPLVKNGLIRPLNDSFNLELGAVADHSRQSFFEGCAFDVDRIAGLLGIRWDFYLTRLWTIFGQAKSGPNFSRVTGDCRGFNEANDSGAGVAIDLGVGGFLNVSRPVSVRFDLTLRGVSAGLSLNF